MPHIVDLLLQYQFYCCVFVLFWTAIILWSTSSSLCKPAMYSCAHWKFFTFSEFPRYYRENSLLYRLSFSLKTSGEKRLTQDEKKSTFHDPQTCRTTKRNVMYERTRKFKNSMKRDSRHSSDDGSHLTKLGQMVVDEKESHGFWSQWPRGSGGGKLRVLEILVKKFVENLVKVVFCGELFSFSYYVK